MFLNNSKSEQFEDCARKHFWSEEFGGTGLQSIYPNENLDFGTIVHVGLSHFYAGNEHYSIAMREEAKKILNWDNLFPDERVKWAEHLDWIDRILKAYEPWSRKNDDFAVFQIESEGCVVLGEICYRCGETYPKLERAEDLLVCPKCSSEIHHWVYRIDLAVNRGEYNPKVNIVDHKTAGSLGDNALLGWHNSLQLWGYCYAYEKQTEMEVSGYFVNIIRKLKSIGLPKDTTKVCPRCRNGVRKKPSCETCKGTGRVDKPIEENSDDIPFVREYEGWDESKREIFTRQRLGTADRILDERERFKHEPDAAFPMNPKSCFKMGRCPYWKLCYTPNDPEKWYLPTDDQLINFEPKKPDYVTVKQLAKEEMI